MKITTYNEPIWPSIKAALDVLAEKWQEEISDLAKAGLSFSLILGSACYVEGVLETFLRALLDCRRAEFNRVEINDMESRRAVNIYYRRAEESLSQDIGRATGSSGYEEMFKVLSGEPLSALGSVKPLWEGITVLFSFRNALRHGREVSARQFAGGAVPDGFREDFRGSY